MAVDVTQVWYTGNIVKDKQAMIKRDLTGRDYAYSMNSEVNGNRIVLVRYCNGRMYARTTYEIPTREDAMVDAIMTAYVTGTEVDDVTLNMAKHYLGLI